VNERQDVSLFSRILRPKQDLCAPVRPLWHRLVEIAREKQWYAECGVADSVAGRFDMVTLVLVLVLLRMEREPDLIEPSVRLTELFVSDMDGQLRNSGVGDLSVGKHMGKLMGVLGGRLGALRDALAAGEAEFAEAVARNVTLTERGDGGRGDAGRGDAGKVAVRASALAGDLAGIPAQELLAGKIAR
jgi:cytochrome b pre-mRNA-processing protein 3